MRFLTLNEAENQFGWAALQALPHRNQGAVLYFNLSDVEVPLMRLAADAIVDAVSPWEEAFLWIGAELRWNREALHLYYRLRQSYGDHRLVNEAPIHYCLPFEATDLLTFVQVGLLNSWRMELTTRQRYGHARVSMDGDVQLVRDDRDDLLKLAEALTKAGIQVVHPPA